MFKIQCQRGYIFFFIRVSHYVMHITRNCCSLHSSSIILVTWGECRTSGFCLWDLQPKYQPLLSYSTLLQNPSQSPSWWNKDFAVQLTLSQQEKPTKRHGSSSAFCLFCRKQTNGSIKAAAAHTLGKIAVRFVTFK